MSPLSWIRQPRSVRRTRERRRETHGRLVSGFRTVSVGGRVHRRLSGRAAVRLAKAGDHIDFVVTLVADEADVVGRLERQTQSGTVAIRELRDKECARVADAIALSLALALDPDFRSEAGEVIPATSAAESVQASEPAPAKPAALRGVVEPTTAALRGAPAQSPGVSDAPAVRVCDSVARAPDGTLALPGAVGRHGRCAVLDGRRARLLSTNPHGRVSLTERRPRATTSARRRAQRSSAAPRA